jgi:hypothetical protein
MDTSNCKEQSKKQEVGARGKIVNKEEAASKKSNTDSVNSGSGPDYQIHRALGWAPW